MDAQGKTVALTTWQDFAGNQGAATTNWNYDSATGLLLSKAYDPNGTQIQNKTQYTYDGGNRLATRKWARGITTTYTYTGFGQLASVSYSGTTTPNVNYSYEVDPGNRTSG